MEKKVLEFVDSIKYDEKGLVTVVTQDIVDGIVLMVAYANKESLLKTFATGMMHYYSRSRKKIWLKGEESGNIQKVKELYFDCDNDCLLVKVEQVGRASCHTGYRSCFYRKVMSDGEIKVVGEKIFDPEKVYKK